MTLSVLGIFGLIAACSTPEVPDFASQDPGIDAECKRGEKAPCSCADGQQSTQTCSSAGRYLECACEPAKAVCGNGKCDPAETCKDCPQDCGACPVCAEARSCKSGAAAPGQTKAVPALDVKLEAKSKARILAELVEAADRGEPGLLAIAAALGSEPASTPVVAKLRAAFAERPAVAETLRRAIGRSELSSALARASLRPGVRRVPSEGALVPRTMGGDAGLPASDGGSGDGGATVVCDPPRLRVRVSKVVVNNPDDDVSKDVIYCFLTSESAAATEGVQGTHTRPTPNLGSGQGYTYGGNEALFWGVKEPKDAAGDLTLRYECWEQDDPRQYAAVVQKAAEILADEVAYREGNGWTSSAVDLAARFLPALLSLDGDDHLFSATQVIPRAQHLALANGGTWTVRKKGTHFTSTWDWTLTVQAWGCVDNGYVQ
ncbi:MAG: hypothetical protein JST00_18355 [Deltaproteobacteria bacterium]|nr:hypothetical protein [Deltaproteobacteria bacterium]